MIITEKDINQVYILKNREKIKILCCYLTKCPIMAWSTKVFKVKFIDSNIEGEYFSNGDIFKLKDKVICDREQFNQFKIFSIYDNNAETELEKHICLDNIKEKEEWEYIHEKYEEILFNDSVREYNKEIEKQYE